MNDYGEMFYGTLPPDTQDFRQVLSGIGKMLRDRALAAGERIGQSGQEAIALQNQIFGDPNRPLRVTDENALRRYTDMIMGGPLGFAPAGITAYHGSPYLFRQFDPAKVGAGEGAQAYGVGAGYTAEARPVAESYKTAGPTGFAEREADKLLFSNKSVDDAISAAQKELNYVKKNKAPKATVDELQNVLNVLQNRKSGVKESGYLYKGDIPDEILPKFLDWDKPLSQQSQEIQNVAKELLPKLRTINPDVKLDNMTGEGLYRAYQAYRGNQPDFASQGLEEMGIRGIRYLDQGSRGEGKGTSNFIPFRAEDYKIQEINDIPIEDWIRKGLLSP